MTDRVAELSARAGFSTNGMAHATVVAAEERPWPELADDALTGLIGAIVKQIAPNTEADPAALLATTLILLGNIVGREPHLYIGDDRHGCNLYGVIVGATAKARKGTSRSGPQRIISVGDQAWASRSLQGGISSGEGLIWAIRDPIFKTNAKGEDVLVDEGVADKRLVTIEEEFSSVLKVIARERNTASEQLRRGWDSREQIAVMTKTNPARVTGPHISVLGHITKDEYLRRLLETEQANGFVNRFLHFCARRSKPIPFPPRTTDEDVRTLGGQVNEVVAWARQRVQPHTTDAAAGTYWIEQYATLSAAGSGLVGAMTARAEAQVMRLALLSAVAACDDRIRLPHLKQALAIWDYCNASVDYLFGDSTGNPIADKIRAAVRASAGLSQTDISRLFSGHVRSGELEVALVELVTAGQIVAERIVTSGAPVTIWRACDAK